MCGQKQRQDSLEKVDHLFTLADFWHWLQFECMFRIFGNARTYGCCKNSYKIVCSYIEISGQIKNENEKSFLNRKSKSAQHWKDTFAWAHYEPSLLCDFHFYSGLPIHATQLVFVVSKYFPNLPCFVATTKPINSILIPIHFNRCTMGKILFHFISIFLHWIFADETAKVILLLVCSLLQWHTEFFLN